MGCHAFPVNKFDAPEIHIDSKYRIELGCLNRPEQESRAESTKAAWARRRLCEPTQIGRSFRRVDQFHNRPADRCRQIGPDGGNFGNLGGELLGCHVALCYTLSVFFEEFAVCSSLVPPIFS